MGLTSGTANKPILPAGWTPLNHSSGQTFVDATLATWQYDYSPKQKKWANAKDTKGNLWVWIPRFTYKMGSDPSVDIKFSNGVTDDTSGGFKSHKAFTFGAAQIVGFWAMKYQAYQDSANGNLPGSKSGQPAYRSIQVSDIFNACRNLQPTITTATSGVDVHMMKNVEWGAVTLLAYAVGQGRPKINGDTSYRTGFTTGGTVNASGSLDTTGETSTTGNPTGVFDMVGCAWEYVASYVNNSAGNLTTYCSALVNADPKYKDVLPVGSGDTQAANFSAAASPVSDGMALNEMATRGDGTYGWLNWAGSAAYSHFPVSSNPMFIRGGYYGNSYSGLSAFSGTTGNADSNVGFRACFVPLNSAPLISGTDSNLGDKNAPFSQTYQVSDSDGDAISVTEKINGNVIRTVSDVPPNTDMQITIDSATWTSLTTDQPHTLTVVATDSKGNASTRVWTFVKRNSVAGAPLLVSPVDTFRTTKRPVFVATVGSDPENDKQHFKLSLQQIDRDTGANIGSAVTYSTKTSTAGWEVHDGQQWIPFPATGVDNAYAGKQVRYTAQADLALWTKWRWNISSIDSATNTESPGTPRIIRVGNVITKRCKQVINTGAAPAKRMFLRADVLVAKDGTIPASLKVEMTNNALDAVPFWEDATTEFLNAQFHTFTNKTKTAGSWAVDFRITINANDSLGPISIGSYGGTFD
ncbi:hypothetical protein P4V33_09150 [Brevibacillus borstelensis]|uniref:hypothetical protein n=1 Tax=Brevibacillus borstelensis TaxID=45462 RepID=UPI002E1EA58D|nr:hypothetical protein [Brevibacillus borstelensis]